MYCGLCRYHLRNYVRTATCQFASVKLVIFKWAFCYAKVLIYPCPPDMSQLLLRAFKWDAAESFSRGASGLSEVIHLAFKTYLIE